MTVVEQLIEENNRKREMLTEENEKYYSDLLLYIRTQISLSEQQSEEVLMEMLDHLLEGQEEGKTAKQIFGDNPKAYADELIEQLPKEDRRSLIPFLAGLILQILSWVLIIRGIAVLIISQFKPIEMTEYPINLFIIALVISGTVLGGVWVIFKLIRESLFTDRNDTKNIILAGIYGGLSFLLIMVTVKFLPKFGPSFEFTWWLSVILGGMLWLGAWIIKKSREGGV